MRKINGKLPFTLPIEPLSYDTVREIILRHKVFPTFKDGDRAHWANSFEERLGKQISYWTMAQIANGMSAKQLIRAVRQSNQQ